ncbi:GNAT family protein [uncultured Georgenia sp.]|uniref:GNAT family N-acetyltransferase n=1 Tax=uncultured Georgenia sp. TaxID=378209 RepID=UPI0026247714|nr:GNAT family protein [uncultured Georgenia sp.]
MVLLEEAGVRLRPLRYRDRAAWQELRARNADWLRPWEATSPVPQAPASFRHYVAESRRLARRGEALTFVIEVDGELAGQLSVSPILLGSLRGAAIGYWVSRHVAGRGVAPTAVALAGDYCFTELGLHRLEINIRPENAASLRVVEKLGFRDEGLRRRYLHIDGDWRDHRTFALVAEEVPGGLLERWRRTRARHAGDGPDGAPPPG